MSTRKIACILAVATGLLSIAGHAEQGLLRIVSPASGTVVNPGQTVTVAVAADSSVEKLVLIGEHPLGIASTSATGPATIWARGEGDGRPQKFQLAIPMATTPGSYHVTAMGRNSSGEVQSEALVLDVERPQDPVRIWAEPAIIQFSHAGDQIPLRVLGAYAGGSQEELTKSSRTMYASQNPSVATVNSEGIVTAVGPGWTSIVVSTPSADYSIPVRVP